jgi:glycosidase
METARELKPDAYLVGEAWDSFGTLQRYYASKLTSFFAFPFGNSDGKIVRVLRAAGRESEVNTYARALEQADTAYYGIHPDYIDAPFLSNHDVGRIAGFVNRDPARTKLAGAMNIFMSGSVFIYYGEEIGMIGSGNDPSKRAPMYWNAARDKGTTNPPPECELPEEYVFGSLEEQMADDLSVYNYYRQAIAIRNAIPAMARGRSTEEKTLNTGCVSAFRKTADCGSCIVIMNINTEAAQADLSGYTGWKLAATLSVGEETVTQKGNTLNLPAFAVAVLVSEA